MGYVNIDTLYEEIGKDRTEVKNDYISVEQMIPVEMIIKRSRFIGMAFHVESDDEVHNIIGNLKKSNKNAKHSSIFTCI